LPFSFLPRRPAGRLRAAACALMLAALAACSSAPPAAPGYHRVQSGETLYSIARRYDRSVSELVRWNRLSNPNQLEVSQVLRVVPPAGGASASASPSSAARPAATRKPAAGAKPPASASRSQPAAPPAGAIKLAWPADGKVSRRGSQAGVVIAGPAGTPVRAAASGRVQFAGAGVRGYGNLVIVGHGSGYLTIYAHNRKLTVAPGQQVKQGQQLAEMGDSDSSQVALYFEVRHNGNPVDALRMLPSR